MLNASYVLVLSFLLGATDNSKELKLWMRYLLVTENCDRLTLWDVRPLCSLIQNVLLYVKTQGHVMKYQ